MKKFFYFILPLLLFISCSHDFSFGNKCTINYQSEYGNCPKQIKVDKGTVLQSEHLPELYEYGHIFTGWYIDDVKIEPNEFTITKNTVLKAGWNYGYEITAKEFYDLAPTLKNLRESISGELTVYITITDENPDLIFIRDALTKATSSRFLSTYIHLDLSRCLGMTTVPNGIFSGVETIYNSNSFEVFKTDFKKQYGFDYTDDYVDVWDYYRYNGKFYMYGQESLYRLILPESIISIESHAFSNIHGVGLLYLPDTIQFFGEDVFSNFLFGPKSPLLKLPSNMQELPKGTFSTNSLAFGYINIIWPENISSIGPFAFFRAYSWSKNDDTITFHIPDTIVTIKNNAFYENDFFTYSMPQTLKIIEKNAFADNRFLKEEDFPASINYIGEKAFANCPELSKITFATGLSTFTIDVGAFKECPKLELFDFSQVFNDAEAWDLTIVSSDNKTLKTFSNINILLKQYNYNLIPFLKNQSGNYSIVDNENIKFKFIKK